MRKEHLKLNETEHSYLTTLTTFGQSKARKIKRAMTLLFLHQGKTMTEVSKLLEFSYPRVLELKKNFLKNGLKCLEEKFRPGRPITFDGLSRAKITGLACSKIPVGHAQWSLRLLADKLVELEICENISHTQVKNVLKKTVEATFEKDLVYWNYECRIYCSNGRNTMAL